MLVPQGVCDLDRAGVFRKTPDDHLRQRDLARVESSDAHGLVVGHQALRRVDIPEFELEFDVPVDIIEGERGEHVGKAVDDGGEGQHLHRVEMSAQARGAPAG